LKSLYIKAVLGSVSRFKSAIPKLLISLIRYDK